MIVKVEGMETYKKLLQVLKDITLDYRIDEKVRHEYVKALQDITDQSQAERK